MKDALACPPLAAMPTPLWRAFEAAEADTVKGRGGQQCADLVSLVWHALIPAFTLVPYRDELRERYEAWVKERGANAFTSEQREWLDRMAEHIATSLESLATSRPDGLASRAAWERLTSFSGSTPAADEGAQ